MTAPEPLAPPADGAWSRSVDVVVIGFGVAGASAALEAHRAGAEVLIVERASGGGGASAQSEGIFYLGGGTALQRDLGYDDSPDNMYAFMRASTSTPDDDALRLFCDDAAEHFDWLEAQGVPFERRAFTGKAVAVRTGEGLLTTGNEKVWPFSDAATPMPRGHQTRAEGGARGGVNTMKALLAAVEHESIPTVYDTGATALVRNDAGVICGVRLATPGASDEIVEARQGVILATGSFNLNDEMTHANFPVVAGHGRPLGIDSNDGAGLRLGERAGGVTRGMDGVIATGSIYPPEQLIFGIMINNRGERFVAEDAYHGRAVHFIAEQPDQQAWLLVDEAHFAYPERGHPLVDVFETVEALESALEVPSGSVQATLDRFNADSANGADEQFHKYRDWLAPLQPPLAAFDISYGVAEYSYIALGGLQADIDGRALDADGQAIPGLYAVGAVAAHFPQNGGEYASGMSLGPGSYFGRRAGRHAATRR
ncbi:MAG: FAD-dependent oxidoreductase [Acidimicrobiales bacterium]